MAPWVSLGASELYPECGIMVTHGDTTQQFPITMEASFHGFWRSLGKPVNKIDNIYTQGSKGKIEPTVGSKKSEKSIKMH